MPGAGEDRGADVAVVAEVREHLADLGQRGAIDRVHRRTIERDGGDVVDDLDAEMSHRQAPQSFRSAKATARSSMSSTVEVERGDVEAALERHPLDRTAERRPRGGRCSLGVTTWSWGLFITSSGQVIVAKAGCSSVERVEHRLRRRASGVWS